MLKKTKRNMLRIFVVFALVFACTQVGAANAGDLATGSWYLADSGINTNLSTYYTMAQLYYLLLGYSVPTEIYYSYVYASNAALSAYYGYLYCYYGYLTLGTDDAYYAYLYAYYSSLYKDAAESDYSMIYAGYDYYDSANTNTYWANYYNTWGTYYASLANYGGYY